MAKNDKITIYCPIDKTREIIQRNSPLFCKEGIPIFDEFPPRQALFFCCGCETFITGKTFLSKQAELCSSCGKKISVFCLCDNCSTIAFDSAEPKTTQKYFIKEGFINESCPSCLKKFVETLSLKHICESLKLTFHTSREGCPFCGKTFSPDESLLDQLKKINGKVNRQGESVELSLNQIKELQERLKSIDDLPMRLINIEESVGALRTVCEGLKQKFEDLKAENASEKKNSERLTAIEQEFENYRQISENHSAEFGTFFITFKKEISRHLNELDSIFEMIGKTFARETSGKNHTGNLEETVHTIEEKFEKEDFETGKDHSFQKPEDKLSARTEFRSKPSIKKYTDDDYSTVVHENISPLLGQMNEPDSSNLTGFVADILKQFPGITALVHYPLIDGALKLSNSQRETAVFYRLQMQGKEFAIPASNSVQNESQFKQYANVYRVETSRLNGKMEIIEPAEIYWDNEIKGYRCKKKGLISIL